MGVVPGKALAGTRASVQLSSFGYPLNDLNTGDIIAWA